MSFIVIEGLDGAGKSTQIGNIAKFFENKGITHKSLHFPRTDSPFFGELVGRFLRGEFGKLNEVNPYLVALLYAGDRRDAANLISQWISNGNIIILDRYVYSNIAFQCAKLSDKDEKLRLRNWILSLEYEYFGIPKPDLNIFLDVPFQFTVERLTKHRTGNDRNYLKGSSDIHEENLDFQERVRQVYLEQEKLDDSFVIVPCTDKEGNMGSPDSISEKVFKVLTQRLKI